MGEEFEFFDVKKILLKTDYKNLGEKLTQNTGTVVTGATFDTKTMEKDGSVIRGGGCIASDTMVSTMIGAVNYVEQKNIILNPYVMLNNTGSVKPIRHATYYVNEASRHVLALRQFSKGLDNKVAFPKLDEIEEWFSMIMEYYSEPFAEFILVGERRDGNIDLSRIWMDSLRDSFITPIERQYKNRGDMLEKMPVKWQVSGSGRYNAGPVMSLFLSMVDNPYDAIERKKIKRPVCELLNILGCRAAFNTVPGASAYVGGHIFTGLMEPGKSKSPEIFFRMYDGKKILPLKKYLPYISESVLDKKTGEALDDDIEESLEKALITWKDENHTLSIRDTLIRAGPYNEELVISLFKNSDEMNINNNTSKKEISKIKELLEEVGIDRYKKRKGGVNTYPQTGIGREFNFIDKVISREEHNNMIIAYKAKCKADNDEKEYYSEDEFDGVVLMRYLSPEELKNKEHVGVVELYDNSKIGWSALATDGGVGMSRQLENLLFESILHSINLMGENENLDRILTSAYQYPIKYLFNTDEARINTQFAVSGFYGIGVKAGDEVEIIEMDPTGISDNDDIIVLGPNKIRGLAEDYLYELKNNKSESFNSEICYYSGILAMLESLRAAQNVQKVTKKKRRKILNKMKERIEIIHITKERATYNSKISRKKINNIIENIIDMDIY